MGTGSILSSVLLKQTFSCWLDIVNYTKMSVGSASKMLYPRRGYTRLIKSTPGNLVSILGAGNINQEGDTNQEGDKSQE